MPLHDDEMNMRREKREAQRRKQQAEAKPRDQRERRGQKCLPEENGAECAAVHAEHAVKAEFLLAATQEKAVRDTTNEPRLIVIATAEVPEPFTLPLTV